MRWKLLLAVFAISLLPSCAALTRPAFLAGFEHELSYGTDIDSYDLQVPAAGASFANDQVDSVRYPRLADAWNAGEAPATPLFGRDPALWLRQLDVTPIPAETGMQYALDAKVMAPYPIRMTLLAMEGGREVALAQGNSESWSPATHVARLGVSYTIEEGSVIIVRMEGAHQVHESHVRLLPQPSM